MGKRNKAVKLTRRKIKYIIRSKTNNKSTKKIATEMKVSISTVKRVWMYWLKNQDNHLIFSIRMAHALYSGVFATGSRAALVRRLVRTSG